MADLSKVKIGGSLYELKDATARAGVSTNATAIATEKSRAEGAESGLSTRIQALESKGRYLSSWDATTGLPQTYPEASQLVEGKYNFRTGDYYIVNKVGETNYRPDGAYIEKTGESTWVVGKAAYTGTLNLGDQFQYDGTNWNHIAQATTVAFANIQGDAMTNTNLAGYLNAKANTADLGDLAAKDSASGNYTPAGTIGEIDATPAGTVELGAFTQTSTAATISAKADYTPAGSVAGTVVATGTVTLNAFTQTATDIASTGKFTPAGSVAATDGGSFSALKSATFAETTDGATGSVQIAGTVSKPAITVNDDSVDTFVKSLKAGDVDAAAIDTTKFSGGSFTGASAASFTQGAKASFTQGSKASFAKGTAISAATEGVTAHMATGSEITGDVDAETLIFGVAATHDVIGHTEATFTANGDDTFTANGDDSFTANSVGTFAPAAISAGFFSAQKLPVVDGTASAVTAVTAELAAAPAFTGKSYIINSTADTALKEVAFTGTEGNLSVAGQYDRATANGATFAGNASGDAITASFTGTKVEQLIPTEVKYDKATANGATFAGTSNKITPVFTGTQGTVTVQ